MASASHSDGLQGTLFFLNHLVLPFITGVIYADSLGSIRTSWRSVLLGPWPTIGVMLIVDVILGSIYFAFVSPIWFLMASLGAGITQFVRLKGWARSS